MIKKLCRHKNHIHIGMMGVVVLSVAMTIPLIYYARDIAHSLRILSHDRRGDNLQSKARAGMTRA